jgi:hypothetical protein
MSSSDARPARPAGCPAWCVVHHDASLGEEDWVHRSTPLTLDAGVEAFLCMSVDPRTGERDGPYVILGGTEHTLEEAAALGLAIVDLAALGAAA